MSNWSHEELLFQGRLTWAELTEVVLDVETQLNRRPLGYVEDDIEMPILTPEVFLCSRSTEIPVEPAHQISEVDLRERARFLKHSKEQLWNRWVREYLVPLLECHNLTHKETNQQSKVGGVVFMVRLQKQRCVADGDYRVLTPWEGRRSPGGQMHTSNGRVEHVPQYLYPLELTCQPLPKQLNPEVAVVKPRPQRKAAQVATETLKNTADYESEEI